MNAMPWDAKAITRRITVKFKDSKRPVLVLEGQGTAMYTPMGHWLAVECEGVVTYFPKEDILSSEIRTISWLVENKPI